MCRKPAIDNGEIYFLNALVNGIMVILLSQCAFRISLVMLNLLCIVCSSNSNDLASSPTPEITKPKLESVDDIEVCF